jgi:protein phosphatase
VSIVTSSFRWTSASRSHPGLRQANEDACLDQSEHALWAVADGMGGHLLGDFASGLAVQSLIDLPAAADLAHGSGLSGDGLEQRVSVALGRLQEVNRLLRAEALRRDVPVIGTTIAALLAAESVCSCLWAGDSRIYLYRAGRLRQLTRDHSYLEAARSRHVSRSDDTLVRPRANLITRALGAEDTLHIDRLTLELVDGDIFLLCTDGLSNEVSELSIQQALRPGICSLACDALVDMALDREARDNITAVVVRAEDLRSPNRTILRAL